MMYHYLENRQIDIEKHISQLLKERVDFYKKILLNYNKPNIYLVYDLQITKKIVSLRQKLNKDIVFYFIFCISKFNS